MTDTRKSKEVESPTVEIVNYRVERRKAVLTVGVLSVWVFFVFAVVWRSNSVALTSESLSLEYVGPLLCVLLISVVFLVIFCLPDKLQGEEDVVYGPVVVDVDEQTDNERS